MRNCVRLSVALVFVVLQACSGGGDDTIGPPPPPPSGTCSPGAHDTADPTGAESYCTAFYAALCNRAFSDCGAELGTGGFTSAQECRDTYAVYCSYDDYSGDYYDAPCGGACIDYVARAACSAFLGSEPQACAEATGPASTPPPACNAIGPGTYSDTILITDPIYDGGHSRSYCIALTAGHSLTLQTFAGLSGTPIDDTILYLLRPDGTLLTWNDDYSGLYSRIYVSSLPVTGTYTVIVAGFWSDSVGSYRLTVTAP